MYAALIVPVYPRGATIPQDRHDLVGVPGVGLNQDEFATVEERRRIGFDHLLGQMIIGKMGPKGSYDSVMVRFGWRSGLGIAPNDRRSIAGRKDGRTDVDCLSCHDSLIVNSVFESRASQSLDRFVKVPGVVKYPNGGRHGSHTYGPRNSAIGRKTLQEDFSRNARLDPECATAHWGIALASGPHINYPLVPPPAAELAWNELNLARKYAPHASRVERDLYEALGTRYANPQPEDRSALDRAYAEAMRKVWKAHPDDPDVGALFAEAMMDLRPWDQWTPEGQPQPGTDEILATLDAVLKLNINHPLANHLYIHAVEASPNPERADAPANRLRKLQPGLAHNVHMPSHIDIRRGRWQQAINSNLKAVEADRKYRKIAGPSKGFLPVYVAHNEHMLAYAAMMTGQSEMAIKHIRDMVAGLPEDFLKEYANVAEGFVAMPMEVLVRFGRWDDILAESDKNYADYMPFTRAFHHAARAIAYAAKGDVAAARKEQAAYLERAKIVPKDEYFGNNIAEADLQITSSCLCQPGKS